MAWFRGLVCQVLENDLGRENPCFILRNSHLRPSGLAGLRVNVPGNCDLNIQVLPGSLFVSRESHRWCACRHFLSSFPFANKYANTDILVLPVLPLSRTLFVLEGLSHLRTHHTCRFKQKRLFPLLSFCGFCRVRGRLFLDPLQNLFSCEVKTGCMAECRYHFSLEQLV